MILTIRTDSPEAEIGLFNSNKVKIDYYTWPAARQLAKDLLKEIHGLLDGSGADWKDIKGIVVFEGPGSFTGLRIGITVANTLAYSLQAPIVAQQGDDWIAQGLDRIIAGQDDKIALPHYGAEANITPPKK